MVARCSRYSLSWVCSHFDLWPCAGVIGGRREIFSRVPVENASDCGVGRPARSWQHANFAWREDDAVEDLAGRRVANAQACAIVAAAECHAGGTHLDATNLRHHLHLVAGTHHAASTKRSWGQHAVDG